MKFISPKEKEKEKILGPKVPWNLTSQPVTYLIRVFLKARAKVSEDTR